MKARTLSFDPVFVTDRIGELVADQPKEFAYRTGISLSAVYNYLGGRVPAIGILAQIALVYGKTLDWFFAEFQPQQAEEFVERRLELVRRPKRAATA